MSGPHDAPPPSPTVPKRRALLRATLAASALVASQPALARIAAAVAGASASDPVAGDPWLRALEIAARFATPIAFRKQDFLVTKYGAKPCKLVEVQGQVASLEPGMLQTPKQGSHDCYPAITAAIADAHKAGGGRVVIPEGVWYIKGPLVLRSNVQVHLAKNARLMFSANPDDYAKYGDIDCGKNGKLVRSRWQGNDCLNFSPLVHAHGQKNIALTGEDWT